MTQVVELFTGNLPVIVDDRSGDVGGSFYYNPLRPYSELPIKWAWDALTGQENPVLLDVGASTGCFSLLTKHHPGMKAYAFEPVPLTFEILQSNIALNELEDRVSAQACGIADYVGRGTLHVVTPEGGSGVSMVNGTPRDTKEFYDLDIPVYTIDWVCRQQHIEPTMIKIDVEGGEWNVLRGAIETISKYHPFLIIEYSPQNARQYGNPCWPIVQMIDEMGYTFHKPEEDLLCAYVGGNGV